MVKDICEKGFYSVENLEKILLEKKIENNGDFFCLLGVWSGRIFFWISGDNIYFVS